MAQWLDWAAFVTEVVSMSGLRSYSVERWAREVTRNGFFINGFNRGLEVYMAKKRTDMTAQRLTLVKGMPEFVNVRLDEGDADKLDHYALNVEAGLAKVQVILDEGYKLSFSKSGDGLSVSASLTGRYQELPNAGKTLTGWGDTWYDALVSVLTKHEKTRGDWSSGSSPQTNRARFS